MRSCAEHDKAELLNVNANILTNYIQIHEEYWNDYLDKYRRYAHPGSVSSERVAAVGLAHSLSQETIGQG